MRTKEEEIRIYRNCIAAAKTRISQYEDMIAYLEMDHTDGQKSETDALMDRLDNLEGCGDNPVYAKEIREIRKRLDELSEREDFKVKFCENCYLRHRLMEEAEHEAE